MTTDTQTELYLLTLRKACSEMEMINLRAARELSMGDWNLDWSGMRAEVEKIFDETMAKIGAMPNAPFGNGMAVISSTSESTPSLFVCSNPGFSIKQ